nr:methylecgonone reductase [Quercus suber]
MRRSRTPEVVPNSGQKMPLIGFGTVAVPLPPSQTLVSVFIDAIEVGYRHFDTASIYGTEEPLGQALAQALQLGLIKSREEIFITSKLWCTDAHHDLVLPALNLTLNRPNFSYRLGLAKSVGVRNFACKKLSQLPHHATIPPAVNQVEMNVSWQQEKLRHFCKEKGIQVSAWSPLGANGALWGTLAVMENPVLKEIAITKEKSVPQVLNKITYSIFCV